MSPDSPAAAARAPWRWPRALGILALALAVFFSPALLGPDQFLYRDTGRMHHGMKAFIAGELRQGHLPQWNPYMGLGVPLPGTAVDATQHPFNLLLVALPFEAGFKAWVLLCYLLGGMGAYAWARRIGLSFAPALAASLVFALSGFLVSSSDNITYLTAAASVPWLLAAFEAWLDAGGALRLVGVVAASWLCAAAGDPQTWGFATGVVVVRGVIAAASGRPRGVPLRRTGLALLATIVGAAPILVPVALWVPLTRRVAGGLDSVSRGRWDLHPLRILEFVVPSLFESGPGRMQGGAFEAFAGNDTTFLPWVASIYVGVTCLALAAFAVRRSAAARLLGVGALVFTWAATGHYLGFTWIANHLPVLGSFRYWEKLTVWPTLFLALAAGLGLEHLLDDRRPAPRFAAATAVAGAMLLAFHGVARWAPDALLAAIARPGVAREDALQLLENARRATGTTGVLLLLLALAAFSFGRGVLSRTAPLVFVGVLALDAASANVRAYVLAPSETVAPSAPLSAALHASGELPRVVTPYEISRGRWAHLGEFESTWRWGAATFAGAFHMADRVGNFDVYTGLNPNRVTAFRLEAAIGRLVPQVGLWAVPYVVVPKSPALATGLGMRPPFDVVAADPELPGFLVRFPHRPRAYLAEDVLSTDAEGAHAFVLDPTAVSSPRTVIEGRLPAGVPAGPPGSARLTVDGTDRVEIDVDAQRTALLVLNDQDAPGWRAFVDGGERPIVTANYLARGVWVDAGAHRVVFQYRAPGLLAGWLALAAGLAAIGAWGAWGAVRAIRRRRSRTSPAGSGASGTSG